jgi:prophage tail gpP-like protein
VADSEARFVSEVSGTRYENSTSWSLQQAYFTPADAFEFTVTDSKNPGKLRDTFRPWQPVNLYLNDLVQLTGRIDKIEGTGSGELDLKVSGRDYFAAFVDAGCDTSFRVAKGDTLESLVMRLLAPFGVTSVSGDGFAMLRNARTGRSSQGTPKDYRAVELEDDKPQEGQGVFQFLNSILARHGFLLQPTEEAYGVALVQPEFTTRPHGVLRRSLSNPDLTNIKSGVASRDYTNVPTVTIARSRSMSTGGKAAPTRSIVPSFGAGSPATIGELPEVKRIFGSIAVKTPFKPGETGDSARVYKPMFYHDDASRNQEQLDRGLRRELAERLQGTLIYRCEVDGIEAPDGSIFCVDTLLTIDDDVENVHEDCWVSERDVSDQGDGPSTTLTLIRPGSYVL